MKISVIIPLYNAEQTLARCVDSLIVQTFADFELLLINDGSTDHSADICAAYAQKYPFIKVLNKPNGGVSSARNAGIDMAQGEWLTFVDADDEVQPTFLSRFVRGMEGNDFCMQSMTLVNPLGERTLVSLKERTLTTPDDMAAAVIDVLEHDLPVSACSSAFRTDMVRRHHLRFDEHMPVCEDTDFVLRYLKHCTSMQLLAATDYVYYTPPKNKTYAEENELRMCLQLLHNAYELTHNEQRRAQYRHYYLDPAMESLFYYKGNDHLLGLATRFGKVCQPYLKESRRPSFRHRLFKHLCISSHPRAIICTARFVMGLYRTLHIMSLRWIFRTTDTPSHEEKNTDVRHG